MIRHKRYLNYCTVCGLPYEATRKGAITCSHACRSKLRHWRLDNRKQAQAAIRCLFTLRCAAQRGYDANATGLIADIQFALAQETRHLKDHGIGIPIPMIDLDVTFKNCSEDTHLVSKEI